MSRILLVDDDNFYRVTLRDLLKEKGFNCHEAENGIQALAFLTDNSVDLVMTDCNMPVMDGLHLLAEIEAQWPAGAPPVIVMTGNLPAPEHIRAQAPEIFAVVSKPFCFEVLLSIIEKALASTTS